MARVTAPGELTGEVLGARFERGVAEVDEGPALAYFRRARQYTVEDPPASTTRADRGDDEDQDEGEPRRPSRKRKS